MYRFLEWNYCVDVETDDCWCWTVRSFMCSVKRCTFYCCNNISLLFPLLVSNSGDFKQSWFLLCSLVTYPYWTFTNNTMELVTLSVGRNNLDLGGKQNSIKELRILYDKWWTVNPEMWSAVKVTADGLHWWSRWTGTASAISRSASEADLGSVSSPPRCLQLELTCSFTIQLL